MNKKGFTLTIEVVLIMILSVAAVVLLWSFFNESSNSFFDRIRGHFTYSNVDAVVEGCNILVNSGSEYAYCCEKKEVKWKELEKGKGDLTCFDLTNEKYQGFINNRIEILNCEGYVC